jgi:predicted Zn-dependent peptidase
MNTRGKFRYSFASSRLNPRFHRNKKARKASYLLFYKAFRTPSSHSFFISVPSLKPEPAKVTSGSVSTLPNGLTVVTENASTTSTVTITYPKAGSASEMMNEQGAALINKCMAFRSGSDMSTLKINRTIEDAGGVPFVTTDRKGSTLGFTVAPENAATLVPLLAVDCSMEKWDVRDAKALAEVEAEVAGSSAQIVLTENLFAAAYGAQSAAGRSMYSYNLSADLIASFRDRAYGLNGAVLTATGVKDHSAFCSQVGELLSASPTGSAAPAPAMTYLGGESRVSASSAGYAHVALAFQAPSSSAVTAVVKNLLTQGGVAGFSGPGLLGVYAGSSSPAELIDALTAALTKSVTPDMVKRAKGLAKAEALFALDGGSKSLAESMTAAVLESGSFTGPADVAKTYDAITEKDVKDALAAMLKSNPSLAAVGDISSIPYHATVMAQLK